MNAGDFAELAMDSWAGRYWAPVLILKACPVRVKVQWMGRDCFGRRLGRSYYVPRTALRVIAKQRVDQ